MVKTWPVLLLALALHIACSTATTAETDAPIEISEQNWEQLLSDGDHEWMIEL